MRHILGELIDVQLSEQMQVHTAAYLFMGSSSSRADISSNSPDVESPGFNEKNSYKIRDQNKK